MRDSVTRPRLGHAMAKLGKVKTIGSRHRAHGHEAARDVFYGADQGEASRRTPALPDLGT